MASARSHMGSEIPFWSLLVHLITQVAVTTVFVLLDFLPENFVRIPSDRRPLLIFNGKKGREDVPARSEKAQDHKLGTHRQAATPWHLPLIWSLISGQ